MSKKYVIPFRSSTEKGIELSNAEHEIFPWGRVVNVHQINDYEIIEYLDRIVTASGTITRTIGDVHMYHVNGENRSCHSLDEALVTAVALRYDGSNTQADKFFFRMIGLANSFDNWGFRKDQDVVYVGDTGFPGMMQGMKGKVVDVSPNYDAPISVLFDGETEPRRCYKESLQRA